MMSPRRALSVLCLLLLGILLACGERPTDYRYQPLAPEKVPTKPEVPAAKPLPKPEEAAPGIPKSAKFGKIAGTVYNRITYIGLAGASLRLERYDGTLSTQLTSQADGVFDASLLPTGYYRMRASLAGFESAETSYIEINTWRPVSLQIALKPVEAKIGRLAGLVNNATDGRGLPGVTVTARQAGSGTTVGSAVTSSDGSYEFPLFPGDYLVDFQRDEYAPILAVPTHIWDRQTTTLNQTMSKVLGDNQFRIVLRWTTPKPDAVRDVDSYLSDPTGRNFNFQNRGGASYDVDLDVDDTTWEGPETITIHTLRQGTYVYYVNNYNTRGAYALSNSDISIDVYRGASRVKQYRVPPNQPGFTYEAFNIVNGQIIDVERFNDSLFTYGCPLRNSCQ